MLPEFLHVTKCCHVKLLLCSNRLLLFWVSSAILSRRGCWTLSNVFPLSMEMIMWVLPLNLFLCWITLIIHVEPTLHHEGKPAWPQCTILSVFFHSVFQVFYRDSFCLCSSWELAYGFYEHCVHIWFSYHLWLQAHRIRCSHWFHCMSLVVFLPFLSYGTVWEMLALALLSRSGRLRQWVTSPALDCLHLEFFIFALTSCHRSTWVTCNLDLILIAYMLHDFAVY